jgi:3-deoxy-D-manno-octulosonic-acid transferase
MLFKIGYFTFAFVLLVVATPLLLLQAFFLNPTKYKKAILEKFFFLNNPSFKSDKDAIWFHTCSMGETKAIKPIIDNLLSANPNRAINISVITNTGYKEAQNYQKDANVEVRYLPFELFLPFWIVPQKALVVMEAELWYALFLFAKKRDTQTMLINARISDKSYKSYLKFSFLYKKIFANIDMIFAQTDKDKIRLQKLGASNIEVIGNIKLATLPKTTKTLIKPSNSTIITAGSTHPSEEELILEAFIKSYKPNQKLIIAPRHPERFDEVDEIIKSKIDDKFSYHRYSKSKKSDNFANFTSDIILVDVLGELVNIYAISDLVILGGAFDKSVGGHNPIEPAYFGAKLISGKKIFNQKALFECVKGYHLIEENELQEYLSNIDNLNSSSLTTGQSDISVIVKELEN